MLSLDTCEIFRCICSFDTTAVQAATTHQQYVVRVQGRRCSPCSLARPNLRVNRVFTRRVRFRPYLITTCAQPHSFLLRCPRHRCCHIGDTTLCSRLTGREQKNNFKSGSEATFQLSGNNKLKNNIYPDGFVWNVDETTCFNKKTDVPELGRLLC